MKDLLLYVGAGFIIYWGLAHAAATLKVLAAMGEPEGDVRRVLTLEWIAESLALWFIGALVITVTVVHGSSSAVATTVYWCCAAAVAVMAIWTFWVGRATALWQVKVCPIGKLVVAAVILVGTLL